MVALAQSLVAALGLYALLGLLFAIPFVLRGIGRIDPVAREGTWGFRLLVLPGTVALWPLLLSRWLRAAQPPTERTPHRAAASDSSGGAS